MSRAPFPMRLIVAAERLLPWREAVVAEPQSGRRRAWAVLPLALVPLAIGVAREGGVAAYWRLLTQNSGLWDLALIAAVVVAVAASVAGLVIWRRGARAHA